jgi:hypothetical protein
MLPPPPLISNHISGTYDVGAVTIATAAITAAVAPGATVNTVTAPTIAVEYRVSPSLTSI